jgi:hypothetical protein
MKPSLDLIIDPLLLSNDTEIAPWGVGILFNMQRWRTCLAAAWTCNDWNEGIGVGSRFRYGIAGKKSYPLSQKMRQGRTLQYAFHAIEQAKDVRRYLPDPSRLTN